MNTIERGSGLCSARLLVGAAMDVVLLLMLPRLAMWSSYERECGFALVYAALGTAAITCAVPVFWQGSQSQRVGAVVVLMLSCLAFWPAVEFWVRLKQ